MSKKQKYDSKKQQFKGKGFYGDPATHEKIIYDSLRQEGASHAIAAAIVGNLKHETGDFKFVEETKPNKHGEYGIGLLQWSQDRGTKFRNWLSDNNKDPRDLIHNVEFMIKELREGIAWTKGMSWEKFNKINDVSKAVEVFADTYLRPALDENGKRSGLKERLTYAQKFMAKGSNYTDPKLLTKEYDVIPKQRGINIGIDAMLKNINFSKSTISMEDLDAMEDRASSFIRSGGESVIGSTNPMDKIIESGYEKADIITMEDIISSHRDPNWRVADYMKEVEAEQRLKASGNGGIPSQNQMALGGQLQPNGRLSQFTREEDLQAQNNTSYTPTNRFENGGPIGPQPQQTVVKTRPDYTTSSQIIPEYNTVVPYMDKSQPYINKGTTFEQNTKKEFNDWYTNSITAQRLKKQTNYNTEQISDMLANAASTRMNRTNNVGLNENAQYTDRTRTIDYNKQDPNVIKHELSHASGLDQQLGEYLLKTTGYPSEQKTNYLSDVQNYLAKPHEAYGNFVEFRAALGLKPGQKIKDIKTLEKLIQQKNVDTNYSRTFDLENILKALNTMADNSNIPTKSNALFNGNLPKEIV